MTVPTMFHDNSVTFYVKNRPYMADESVPGYAELREELKKANPDEARLIALTEPARAIEAAVKAVSPDYLPAGTVSVTRTQVLYNGEPLKGVLVDRILQLLAEGFDFMPMVRFLENVYTNPAEYTRDDLYLWLEKSDLPITEDGCFLAYKRVRSDYGSIWDNGATKNLPGTTVSIPRQSVDQKRANECSTGLHFCSKDYLTNGPSNFSGGYQRRGAGYMDANGSRILLVKVNPADVVAIPGDYGNTKGRTWKYDILEDVSEEQWNGKWASVTTNKGKTALPAPKPEPVKPVVEYVKYPSDLSRALYAAIGEVVSTSNRKARLFWASAALGKAVGSFTELTVDDASNLIDRARAEKARADAKAKDVKQARVTAIYSYGIEKLRAEASQAGLKGAWKGPNKAALQAYLISKV